MNKLAIFGLSKASVATVGFSGDSGDHDEEATSREFFHPLPEMPIGFSTVDIAAETEPGEIITGRLRGMGQFGIFRKAVSDQTDWKLRIYSDNDRQLLLAEFTG